MRKYAICVAAPLFIALSLIGATLGAALTGNAECMFAGLFIGMVPASVILYRGILLTLKA